LEKPGRSLDQKPESVFLLLIYYLFFVVWTEELLDNAGPLVLQLAAVLSRLHPFENIPKITIS
jgi:hypothetical protein